MRKRVWPIGKRRLSKYLNSYAIADDVYNQLHAGILVGMSTGPTIKWGMQIDLKIRMGILMVGDVRL